jgi:3'(2'), 5'-bisphosphate nucleotidase/myo-inositol-1(or 4)-monophosphatase
MELKKSDLKHLHDCAVTAALEAGQLIAMRTNEKVEVQIKKGGLSLASQVVTEVDLESQAIIRRVLTRTLQAYDLAFLGEEEVDDGGRFEKDYFWCVDPLDGTLSFAEGIPGYSVSIALVSAKGVPWIGVVCDPVQQRLLSAIKGRAGTAPLAATDGGDGEPLSFYIDRSFLSDKRFSMVRSLLDTVAKKRQRSGIRVITGQGAVLNACSVLHNSASCYFKFPHPEPSSGSLWDFAASACIVEAMGGWVSDIFGRPLDLNRRDSTFMNHKGVLYASDASLARDVMNIYQTIEGINTAAVTSIDSK